VRKTALVEKRGSITVSERALRPKEWVMDPKKPPATGGTRAADDFRTIKARLDELTRERAKGSDKKGPK
jgi:hypothetical protein